MIKASELRVWNWINIPTGHMEVIKIDASQKVLFINSLLQEHCDGIRLTPEILEKCGFIDNFGGYFTHPSGFNIDYSGTDKTFKISVNGKRVFLEYIHTLQNIFYIWSSGNELEYKP